MAIETKSRKIFNICNVAVLGLLGIAFLLPYVISRGRTEYPCAKNAPSSVSEADTIIT